MYCSLKYVIIQWLWCNQSPINIYSHKSSSIFVQASKWDWLPAIKLLQFIQESTICSDNLIKSHKEDSRAGTLHQLLNIFYLAMASAVVATAASKLLYASIHVQCAFASFLNYLHVISTSGSPSAIPLVSSQSSS